MTELQKQVTLAVGRATLRGEWYRAASSGQRVTLASLFRAGMLKRRAWRGVEGAADAAHEYQLSDAMIAAVKGAAETFAPPTEYAEITHPTDPPHCEKCGEYGCKAHGSKVLP